MDAGTLKELNVKPGDVVECVSYKGTYWTPGDSYRINRDGTIPNNFCNDYHISFPRGFVGRIISRASDTPKTWGEMTEAERRDISFAAMSGREIEIDAYGGWVEWDRKTPLCETHQRLRIKPAPKREAVTLLMHYAGDGHPYISRKMSNPTHQIDIAITDGEITSIDWEKL